MTTPKSYFTRTEWENNRAVRTELLAAMYSGDKFIGNWTVSYYVGPDSVNSAKHDAEELNAALAADDKFTALPDNETAAAAVKKESNMQVSTMMHSLRCIENSLLHDRRIDPLHIRWLYEDITKLVTLNEKFHMLMRTEEDK